jgi:hypothetical protein
LIRPQGHKVTRPQSHNSPSGSNRLKSSALAKFHYFNLYIPHLDLHNTSTSQLRKKTPLRTFHAILVLDVNCFFLDTMTLSILRKRLDSSTFDPSSQIRVLVLDGGEPRSQISASFQFVTLKPRTWRPGKQKVEWEAVSYAWEGQTPSYSYVVKIDGNEKYVTSNVYKILGELRHRSEKRFLWIDALCINQEDKDEKLLQVGMMRSIYRKAHAVIAWLCPKPSYPALAVADAAWWMDRVLDQSTLSIQEPLLTCFRLKNSGSYCERPFQKVLSLPWFQRIWVVQEAAVAQSLLVYLGGQILPWELFASSVLRFMSYLDASEAMGASLSKCFAAGRKRDYDHSDPSQAGLTMVNLIISLREWWRSSSIPIPASQLVFMCRDRKATLPADMIYAVSGFFGRGKGTALLKAQLPISYDMPTAEVYMGFTVWCLLLEKNLDILAQQRQEDGYRYWWPELPTWTTDWTHLSLNDFNIAERRTTWLKTSSSLNSTYSPRFRRKGNILILKGFFIDTFRDPSMVSLTTEGDYYNWLQRIPDDKSANRVLFGEESPTIQTLERLYSRTIEKDSRLSHLWRDGASLSKDETMKWHSKFLTDGGCLAITFPYFQSGAKICCFFGGRSLFVLQPKKIDPETGKMVYALITGQCLIDGFEDGKGVNTARRLGLKKKEIYIE